VSREYSAPGAQASEPSKREIRIRRNTDSEVCPPMSWKLCFAATLIALLFMPPARSQSTAPDPLFKTIQSLDARFFDAYNRCDLTTMRDMVAEDLEFYHDKTGLARGRQSLIDGVKNNICGKVTRELVPSSMEVYPLANYGAVEIGVHRFHHPGREQSEPVGEAKFIHVWQNKNGVWLITRVISFDHQSIDKPK
jgi:ketosteroid isomerase-like protein